MAVKVGDKIRITDASGTRGKYKNGDVLTVTGFLYGNYVEVEEHDRIIGYKEFEVVSDQTATDAKLAELEERLSTAEGRIAALEAAQPSAQQAPQPEQYRKVTDRSPQVGDYVKYDEAPSSYFTDGKYYEITRIDSSNDPHINDDDGDDFDTYDDGGFEVYEKVDKQAQPTQDDSQQPLKVGDYAVTRQRTIYKPVPDGVVVEITELGSRGAYVKMVDGCGSGFVYLDELIPTTDEEVAEAKATAKFAEIGRKPGEFKAGDIVKGMRTLGNNEVIIGEMDYDGEPDGKGNHGITSFVDGELRSVRNVELITPVERRFDR